MMTATCGYGLLRKGEIISFRDVFLHKYTNPMWLILDTYTHNQFWIDSVDCICTQQQ